MVWKNENHSSLFIGGKWVAPSTADQLEVISPFTEGLIASTAAASSRDVDRAVSCAREAFDCGPWPRTTLEERTEAVGWLGRQIALRCDDIASVVSAEMGCPITQSLAIQATAPSNAIDAFLELAAQYPFRALRRSPTGDALVVREPVGLWPRSCPGTSRS